MPQMTFMSQFKQPIVSCHECGAEYEQTSRSRKYCPDCIDITTTCPICEESYTQPRHIYNKRLSAIPLGQQLTCPSRACIITRKKGGLNGHH
jgi:hypothetical protein